MLYNGLWFIKTFETKKLKCFFMTLRMHTHKYNIEYYNRN
jgi:hypothetical protein